MATSRSATTSGAPASAAAFSPTLPAHAAGNRILLAVLGKDQTTTMPTVAGGDLTWVLLGQGTGGTGTNAADTGQVFWQVWGADCTSAAHTAPTVTPGGTAPNSWVWFCQTWAKTRAYWMPLADVAAGGVTSGSDTTTASPLAGSGTFTYQPATDDGIATFGVIPTDLGTTLASVTVAATGVTAGTISIAGGYVENALGNDVAGSAAAKTIFTGTSTGATTFTHTFTGATENSGVVVGVLLRDSANTPATSRAFKTVSSNPALSRSYNY